MAQSHPGSFRLFQAFGISVFLHWSWFVVAVIQIQTLRDVFHGPYWHVALYLSLFAIVLLHEFGHALACRSVGGRADQIVLWPLGGIAFVQPPQRPGAVLWSIAAGPLVNVVLLPITLAAMLFVGPLTQGAPVALAQDIDTFAFYVFAINLGLLLFNILPIYPLDGGQILQAILWFFIGRAKALTLAAGFGLIVAAVVAIPILLIGEWLLFFVALFIGWQAYNGLRYARALAALETQHRPHIEPWKM